MNRLYDVTAPEGIDTQELDELNQLITVAPDNETPHGQLARMRDYLVRFPDLAQQLGDIARFSLQNISAYAAADKLTQDLIRASADELKRQLARPGDTPLEKFAVEQCIHAHILYYTIELRYINAHSQASGTERSLYWEQRLTLSQKRYIRALNHLARLRRTAAPPIPINMHENQTDISAPSPEPASPLVPDTVPGY